MRFTKAELQELYYACVIFLRHHKSDMIEHLMWRLEKEVQGG